MINSYKRGLFGLKISENFTIESLGDSMELFWTPIEDSISIWKNGFIFYPVYSITGKILQCSEFIIGDEVIITYISQQPINYKSDNFIVNEVLSGLINGMNNSFTTEFDFVPESLEVLINGVTQEKIVDYINVGARTILFTQSIELGDKLLVNYLKKEN